MPRYKGGSAARDFDLFGPDLRYEWITPQLTRATSISDATLRSEYSRLRAIANKRIARMEGKPEAAGTLENLPASFPSVRGMDRADVVKALEDVTGFLTARRGSLSGIRETNKRIRESLAERGIRVKKDDLNKFGPFMNKMKKALNIKRGEYASAQLASIWDSLLTDGKISKKKFKQVMDDLIADRVDLGEMTDEDEIRAKRIVRSTDISEFFDDVSLDPRSRKRTKKGRKKKRI